MKLAIKHYLNVCTDGKRRHIDKMQPIKYARQPPDNIDYFAQQPNTARTTNHQHRQIKHWSMMLNWMSAQAPFQDISTANWLENHCSHHEHCINTISSSNIQLTKESYKSNENNEPITFSNNKKGKLFYKKKIQSFTNWDLFTKALVEKHQVVVKCHLNPEFNI
jgi:hypothetical protein